MTDIPESKFRPLSILALLRGAKVYEFEEFYHIKNALIRYDHRDGYVNFGLWDDGDRTVNPSAALVRHVAEKLQLGPTDVLLNVGSGLGQPDIDIAQAFKVKRIIGINRNAAQVSSANRMFADQRLDDVIHHRVCDALAMEDQLRGLGISAAIIVEALAEMPSPERVLAQVYSLLPVGGRISLCDPVTTPTDQKSSAKRLLGRAVMNSTSLLYGDHWERFEFYRDLLTEVGFHNVQSTRIGDQVYSPMYQYARTQWHKLRAIKAPRVAKMYAYLHMRGLAALYAWRQIDYAVYWGQK
jgi:cyclopropane fatty-acyl-phospholipid synthase-like methyltransferase